MAPATSARTAAARAGVRKRALALAQRAPPGYRRRVSGEATALLRVLLAHHQRVCRPPGSRISDVSARVINYGRLCSLAGIPWLVRSVGPFLLEIAKWCDEHGYPPLNSLAVNAESLLPGDSYDGAGNFRLANWPADVARCLTFGGYPSTPP